jgi:hypothetical protein
VGSLLNETAIASVVDTPLAEIVTAEAQAADAITPVPRLAVPLATVCVIVPPVTAEDRLEKEGVPNHVATPEPGLKVAKDENDVPPVFVQVIAFDELVVQSPLISEAVKGEPPLTIPVNEDPVPVPPCAIGRAADR